MIGLAGSDASGVAMSASGAHRPSPPLQGRGPDVDAVDLAIVRATAGTGGLLVFTGPIGAGRSALLDECAHRAAGRGLRVLRAGADDASVLDLLRAVAPAPAPDDAGPGEFRALHAALADLASDTPTLLLVDDLTRCDVDSLRLLAFLAHRLADIPLVVVLAAADGDHTGDTRAAVDELLGRADAVRPLTPLTFEGTAVLARSRLGDRAVPAVLDALTEVSGGNPLVLACVLDAVTDDPAVDPAVDPVTGPAAELERRVRECSPPRLLARMIVAVRAASDPVRRYLAAVAAVGDVADGAFVVRLTGMTVSDADAAHHVARRTGLTGPGDRPRLRHHTVAEALDADRSADDRREAHLRAAALLRARDVSPERVARHLLAISDVAPGWPIEVLREAAARAADRGAPRDAVAYLRGALLAEPDPHDRARLMVDLATYERSLDAGLALRRIVQAVPLLDSALARADALCRVTPLALDGAPPSMVAMIRSASDELARAETPAGDAAATRELVLRLEARLHFVDKDTRTGLTVAADRLDELEREPGGLSLDTPGERELACVLLYSAALCERRTAAEVAAVSRIVLAREPASPEHVHSTIGMLVTCLCMADAVEDLPAWLTVAAERAAAQRADMAEAVVRAELAGVLVCAGRVGLAQEQVTRSLELVDDLVDDSPLPGLVLAPLLTALEDRGPADRVLARYGTVRSVPPGFGACLQMLRARSAADSGQLDTALEYCLDAGRRFERAGWTGAPVPWRSWAVGILRGLGRLSEARTLAEQELARTRRWGAPTPLGRALRMLGELVEPERAGPLLTEAASVLQHGGDATELDRATRSLDAHLGRSTVGPSAAGTRPDRLPTSTGPSPAPADPPDGGPPPGHSLTRAEVRVAAQAARGLTNQEIAGALDVSVRAVEKHLTGVYRKLGLTGRSALCQMWEGEADLTA